MEVGSNGAPARECEPDTIAATAAVATRNVSPVGARMRTITATDGRAQANAGAVKSRDAAAVGIAREALAAAIDVTANSDANLKANDTRLTANWLSAIENAQATTAYAATAGE